MTPNALCNSTVRRSEPVYGDTVEGLARGELEALTTRALRRCKVGNRQETANACGNASGRFRTSFHKPL